MGQRLNIEIKKKDKIIANSYYHWSGYSQSSLALTKKIIDKYESVVESNSILYAVRLLGLSGAGLTRESISHLYNNIEDFDICEQIQPSNPFVITYKYPITGGRDQGLIEITEKGMEENRKWEEARITIDIENKTFDFGAFGTTNNTYGDEVKELKDFKYKDIKFEEIDEYIKYIDNLIENDKGGHYYKVDGIDKYIWFIY